MRGISAGGGASGAWRGVVVAALALSVWPFAGALSDARTTSGLRVELAGAPQRVQGSDGREHIEYDLVITNAFAGEATLRSLVVRGGGRRLLSLSGTALGVATVRLGFCALEGSYRAGVDGGDAGRRGAGAFGRA